MAGPATQDLERFAAWLQKYGRGEGTAALYVRDVRHAYAAGGPLRRLGNDDLAPKTRRHILAACRAWADFREDGDLLVDLRKVRLPPPARQTAKVPLERHEWFGLLDAIDASQLRPAVRAVLGVMASRGLRVSDVLRLRRREVVAALDHGTLAFEAKGRRRHEYSLLDAWRPYLELLAAQTRWDRVDELVAPGAAAASRRKTAAKTVARALRRVAREANLVPETVYPHRLRRTYATEYLRELKGDPEALIKLQQHMGWRNLATAMEYVDHSRREQLDEVARGLLAGRERKR